MRAIDPKLLDFCKTDFQRKVIEARLKANSATKAAMLLGCGVSNVSHTINRVIANARLRGYDPKFDLIHPVSEATTLRGTSTLYDADGNVVSQWVKTSAAKEDLAETMRVVADELSKSIKPIKPTALKNKQQLDELLNLYVLTDAHFGMHAWAEETGANWDLDIAEETVLAAMQHLTAVSPNAKTGFFLQLGDALHYDGILPVTPTSQHVVDTDSRFHKVVRTVIRVFRQCISLLLQKHEKVVVLMAQGNHDLASSIWLQEWFKVLYENEPRVEVIICPKPYYAYIHGDVLIGAHHGHKKSNLKDLANTFIAEYRHLYGTTKRTYIHTGHLHRDEVLPMIGSTRVERHETLAARDSHATHGGYWSLRSMPCITYGHHAEISRCIFHPEGYRNV